MTDEAKPKRPTLVELEARVELIEARLRVAVAIAVTACLIALMSARTVR